MKEGRRLNWKQARGMLGCGKTKFYDLVNSGELKALRVGKRGLIIYEKDVLACLKPVCE